MWCVNPWAADWAGGTYHRGNGRLVDPDCEIVDGSCCRRLLVRLEASVEGVVIEAVCRGLWQMVILIDC
jgi:hypothetical protein